MHLRITTPVAGNYLEIMARFDQSLFEALKPPFGKVELVRFDGSVTGDRVHIRLFLPLVAPQDWISEITDHGQNEQEAWFLDEGKTLPFFLSYWKHRHVVLNKGDHALIVDDITFLGNEWLPSWMLYPVLWMQFAARKSVYQRIFGKPRA